MEKKPEAGVAKPFTRTEAAPCFHSRELFGGRREVCIEHAGQIYRLRITRQNKLILTK